MGELGVAVGKNQPYAYFIQAGFIYYTCLYVYSIPGGVVGSDYRIVEGNGRSVVSTNLTTTLTLLSLVLPSVSVASIVII